VNRVVEISQEGRAPKNDTALFVLAMASASDSVEVRKAALAALPKVARIGTHLFNYAQFVSAFRGWGRALRKAVAGWYNDKELNNLEYQVMKYKQRNGWSHRDLLRLAHPKTDDEARNLLYKFVVKKEDVDKSLLSPRMQAAEQVAVETDVKTAINLITEYNLPREVINTKLLNDKRVWEALLAKMPMTAMIRNLGKMSNVGLVTPMSDASRRVVDALEDEVRLGKARIHPLAVLSALRVYGMGRGVRGKLVWTPDQDVIDALDKAFYKAFKNVEPTGKRIMLALDVSGSMGIGVNGLDFISCRDASAVLALVTAAVEKQRMFKGFTGGGWYGRNTAESLSGFIDLNISPRQRLDTVINNISMLPFGGTDCALPMVWATKNNAKIDAFVVYTDSETWAGSIHPKQALDQYRNKTGIPAKCIVVGMASNGFTIADPDDAGMLDVVGFDTATPQIISNFIKE
jgi:60 kDa SS-A/Ro ribonucleoprotein